MTDDHKALVHRLFEQGFNERATDIFDELIATNYVEHAREPFRTEEPGKVDGPKHMRSVVDWLVEQFPDVTMRVLDVVADGKTFLVPAEPLVPRERWEARRALGDTRRPHRDDATRRVGSGRAADLGPFCRRQLGLTQVDGRVLVAEEHAERRAAALAVLHPRTPAVQRCEPRDE